jgi:hypothetical protein
VFERRPCGFAHISIGFEQRVQRFGVRIPHGTFVGVKRWSGDEIRVGCDQGRSDDVFSGERVRGVVGAQGADAVTFELGDEM